MIIPSAWKHAILAIFAFFYIGAAPFRPAPKFEGKSIPDPPRQRGPWTPPETTLPRFLVAATAELFAQRIADPRGCEYREVEVGDRGILATRGFVFPAAAGGGRFVVTWDGTIYPAITDGAAANLDKDVRELADTIRRNRKSAGGDRRAVGRFRMFGAGGLTPVDQWSPLKVPLLLRLGRADLAEALFAAATPWTPGKRRLDLTDYGISYLTLATDWASLVFVRMCDAHVRGDDAIALDAARRLSAFAAAVEARAQAVGFEHPQQQRTGTSPRYLPFLGQLPEILADQERRAREPERAPIPPRGADPSARVAALIRDLDEIRPGVIVDGGASPLNSQLEQALVAEGDAAFEPLLAAFETDRRLTRTVSFSTRGPSIHRHVHPVAEVELAALIGILRTTEFNDARMQLRWDDPTARKALSRSLRAFWEKNRAIPPNERWYRMLRDDSAGPERWQEAASEIVRPKDARGGLAVGAWRLQRPGQSPMAGEELRARRDPSVSELFARRVAEMTRSVTGNSLPDRNLYSACTMAMLFDRWDEKAALPAIRTLMARCLDVIAANRDRNRGVNLDRGASGFVAGFTIIRAQDGDRAALGEYAAWVRRTTPEELDFWMRRNACFEPLWRYPDDPSIREAAHWLFNDPESPWVPLLRDPGGDTNLLFHHTRIYSSPLVCTEGFREGLVAAMAIRTPMGTIRRVDDRNFGYRTGSRDWGENFRANLDDVDALKVGESQPFRVRDFIAWKVSAIEGAPRCELYWPEERRDRAVQACVDFLDESSDRFTADAPPGVHDFPEKRAHLAAPRARPSGDRP